MSNQKRKDLSPEDKNKITLEVLQGTQLQHLTRPYRLSMASIANVCKDVCMAIDPRVAKACMSGSGNFKTTQARRMKGAFIPKLLQDLGLSPPPTETMKQTPLPLERPKIPPHRHRIPYDPLDDLREARRRLYHMLSAFEPVEGRAIDDDFLVCSAHNALYYLEEANAEALERREELSRPAPVTEIDN